MAESVLTRLANECGSDKGTRIVPYHNYCSFYESYFSKIREKKLRLLEIGVCEGYSLRLWNEYFPQAEIYGLELQPARVMPENLVSKRVHLVGGDQSDRSTLLKLVEQAGGPFDIIIDDGGHRMAQQQVSFGILFPHLSSGGLYAIEDLHTSWYPRGYPIYGSEPIDIDEERSNTTLRVIDRYREFGFFGSSFLSKAENLYITNHVKSCELFDERLAIFEKI